MKDPHARLVSAGRDHQVHRRKAVPADPGQLALSFSGGRFDIGIDGEIIAVHEIGHNWDEASENASIPSFRSISRWSQDRSGTWSFVGSAQFDFVSSQGVDDPLEDFATTFAAFFMDTDYYGDAERNSPWSTASPATIRQDYATVLQKFNYMTFFI